MALRIGILGAGIAGLTSALALQKNLPEPEITIYEVRDAPSTIGGAVNLTPKALRYLDHLGVFDILVSNEIGAECKTIELFDLYSGAKYGEVDFRGGENKGIGIGDGKKFFAKRVMRRQLQEALLEAVKTQNAAKLLYGRRVTRIEEPQNGQSVQLTFEGGEMSTHDLLLGCDGIHSATRSLLADPNREPTYTGIAVVMASAKIRPETTLRWETTGLTSSRRGSFMASYYEKTRKEQYLAVVMEIKEVADREGWKIRGSDQKAIKDDIMKRFRCDVVPELAQLVEDAGDWTLYPTYMLPPRGEWVSPGQKCILLGDAAHAMPPQGESTGICIEDAVVFSRALMNHKQQDFPSIFAAYENFRRAYIGEAYRSAVMRWETVKDSGAIAYWIKKALTPWFLWWTAKQREEEFSTDYSNFEFQF